MKSLDFLGMVMSIVSITDQAHIGKVHKVLPKTSGRTHKKRQRSRMQKRSRRNNRR